MANNKLVSKKLTTGINVYVAARNQDGDIWNVVSADATVEPIDTITWATEAATVMPEQGATGQYRVTIPATLPLGLWDFSLRQRAGGSPAVTDTELELQRWFWDGTDKFEPAMFQTAVSTEAVPSERTFILMPTVDQGLVGSAVKSAKAGTSQTFAVDFRHDSAANAQIAVVGTPTFLPDSGITLVSTGVFGVQARLRLTLTTAGLYTITVPVIYATGNSAKGTVELRVVE